MMRKLKHKIFWVHLIQQLFMFCTRNIVINTFRIGKGVGVIEVGIDWFVFLIRL